MRGRQSAGVCRTGRLLLSPDTNWPTTPLPGQRGGLGSVGDERYLSEPQIPLLSNLIKVPRGSLRRRSIFRGRMWLWAGYTTKVSLFVLHYGVFGSHCGKAATFNVSISCGKSHFRGFNTVKTRTKNIVGNGSEWKYRTEILRKPHLASCPSFHLFFGHTFGNLFHH